MDGGTLEAILQASHLGMVRTGAASGVATRRLARTNSAVVATIGAGKQAVGQLEAVCRVRGIREVRVCSRTADYWRAPDAARQAQGGSGAAAALHLIEDPSSDLNRQWDEEHDRYVLNCLLDLVDEEFEPTTLRAFRRLALDGASGAEVAQELGLSVAAVYVAKSRVLQRIRQEAEGLID